MLTGQKFLRGQVWWTNDPEDKTNVAVYDQSIKGRRPVLIVSDDLGNFHSNRLIVVPITSATKAKRYPMHVHFELLSKVSIILCEQIKGLPKYVMEEYICTLPDKLMDEVERAIGSALSLKKPVPDSIEKLEKVIYDIVQNKIEDCTTKENITDDFILKVASGISDILKDTVKKPAEDDIKEKDYFEKNSVSDKSFPKKEAGYWTKERKEDFIFDMGHMDKEEVIKKWEMNSYKTALAYKNTFISESRKTQGNKKKEG